MSSRLPYQGATIHRNITLNRFRAGSKDRIRPVFFFAVHPEPIKDKLFLPSPLPVLIRAFGVMAAKRLFSP